ncbi:MAG: VanZ family protein [Verrucomicrobia bacterium]|nr:VanZ family protein [Verrucomicrobiota bacterium]
MVSRDVPSPISKFKPAWIWPVALATTIFFASARSHVAGPAFQSSDKIVHFLVYGLLGSLVCRLGQGWRSVGWAVLIVSGFGATDEWHQYYTPGRSAEVADWVADTLGAALATSLYVGWPRYRRLLEFPLGRKRRVEIAAAAGTLPPP